MIENVVVHLTRKAKPRQRKHPASAASLRRRRASLKQRDFEIACCLATRQRCGNAQREFLQKLHVEVAFPAQHPRQRFVCRPRLLVGPNRGYGVIDIADRRNARVKTDLVSGAAAGITAAINALVMIEADIRTMAGICSLRDKISRPNVG